MFGADGMAGLMSGRSSKSVASVSDSETTEGVAEVAMEGVAVDEGGRWIECQSAASSGGRGMAAANMRKHENERTVEAPGGSGRLCGDLEGKVRCHIWKQLEELLAGWVAQRKAEESKKK